MLNNPLETCRSIIGQLVYFKGTNGDEYDKVHHGEVVHGIGLCTEYHNSHGLCIMVTTNKSETQCVDIGINSILFPVDQSQVDVLEHMDALSQFDMALDDIERTRLALIAQQTGFDECNSLLLRLTRDVQRLAPYLAAITIIMPDIHPNAYKHNA